MPVAILIPVYKGDHADLFEAALVSVEEQQLATEEARIYLGIDGPLPADIEQVVERHLPRIYRVVRSEVHIGPSAIMNALYFATEDEELIFRMDADDVSLPGRLQQQIDYMAAHPDIHILGSSVEEFDRASGQTVIRRFPTDPDRMTAAICFANPVSHPAVCLRREVLVATGGYPQVRNQDLALWFEALARGFRISNLEPPLVRMNVSPEFFARRRRLSRAWPEFLIYVKGIWRLHGISWRYVYPVARLVFRLLGASFNRWVYASGLRNLAAARHRRLR